MELDTEELDVVILQEECRELQRKVDALETENANLRASPLPTTKKPEKRVKHGRH